MLRRNIKLYNIVCLLTVLYNGLFYWTRCYLLHYVR